jgi:tripartite-type tricarboxylate transporter receptor subunit TctC
MSYSSLALAQKGKVRLLAVATPQRLAYFRDTPDIPELGIDWVDGAYRGVGRAQVAPEDVRKRVSDAFAEINRDADFRRKMTEQGLEIVDITYDKMPAFMEERKKAYLSAASCWGWAK